jgi:hypothetical protein
LDTIAAVAIGLNPYVGTFVLAALAAFTGRLPEGALGAALPGGPMAALAILAGAAAPLDFVLCKFVRFAPRVRRYSQAIAPAAGALFAVALTEHQAPLPVVAAGGALLSWSVAAMLTGLAARASRSPAWVGLGHIPVLMSAATAAACIVPLALAKPGIGYGLVAATLSILFWSALAGRPAAQRLARSAARPGSVTSRAGAR